MHAMSRRISLKSHQFAVAPRLTPYGAALLALAVALPVGGVLWLIEALLF